MKLEMWLKEKLKRALQKHPKLAPPGGNRDAVVVKSPGLRPYFHEKDFFLALVK